MKTPYILCAAVWFKNGKQHKNQPKNIETGIVVCGRRHHNCYLTAWDLKPNISEHIYESNNRAIQGFLTSDDKFVDRKEGGIIAFDAGQITSPTDCLFSEDLY